MRPRIKRLKPVKQDCSFCKEKTNPSVREVEKLGRFVTDRGKILPQTRTGICRKHQRKIAIEIKYARHIALLPFIVRPR